MIIPSDLPARQMLYQDLVRQCLASRESRYSTYLALRNYYLFGAEDSMFAAPHNKIDSTIDTLSSFIYAPDTARFSIHLGTTANDDDLAKIPKLSEEVNDRWRLSGTHLLIGLAVRWALTFGSMFVKVLWRGGPDGNTQTYLVDPSQFGVLREDKVRMEDQEAVVHCYTITRTQLERELANHPRRNEIMMRAGGAPATSSTGYPEGLSRLMLSSGIGVSGNNPVGGGSMLGGMTGAGRASYTYAPQVEAELIDMFELYVWDDDLADYRMITIVNPDVVIYDRKNVGIKGLLPFVKFAPEHQLHDYFWGASFVAKLTWLQDWRTSRLLEIRDLLNKQVDPPMSFSGFAGIAEEKMLAMRRAGGQISSTIPGAKAETHAPSMPPDLFREVTNIDQMFDDQAGIGHILQGRGESGVRSKGQADLMARLGSSRPKSRATMVEESCAATASLMLRCTQDHSKQRFTSPVPDKQGNPLTFIAEQFTKDYEVRVDAHSSSPIFIEDRKHDALTLMEAKAIDRETLLDMFDPPNLPILKVKLRAMEKAEKEMAEKQMAAEAAKGKKHG
jgi:hypothetical protein